MDVRGLLQAALDTDTWLQSRTWTETHKVTQPAAGADWSDGPGGNRIWLVLGGRAQLQTSAVVANRTPDLTIAQGGVEHTRVHPGAVQAAGVVNVYSLIPGANNAAGAGPAAAAWGTQAPLLVPPGHRIGSSTGLIDVADQWSAVVLLLLIGDAAGLAGWAEDRLRADAEVTRALVAAKEEYWEEALSLPIDWATRR